MHSVEMGGKADRRSPDLVLVHGLGMSNRYMMPTVERLFAWGNVVHPSHGRDAR